MAIAHPSKVPMAMLKLKCLYIASMILATSHGFSTELQSGDTVILNGSIIDGTGADAISADIVVRGDKIVAMEELGDEVSGENITVLDAAGLTVSPGFIDTHSHGNPIERPEMENFLAMGVTTICLGQDGDSTNVSELEEWFLQVKKAQPGPNVLTFIGHGTVRHEAGIGLSTEPTAEQIKHMEELVEKGMELGAFGLTTGLEYQPGTFARKEELAAIARPVGQRNRVLMSHVRNEDDDQLFASIRELIEQCRESGARAHVSHIKSVYGKGAERAGEIIGLLEEGRQSGVEVTADIYPYTASYTGIGLLFPDYALPPNDYNQVIVTDRDRLLDYLDRRVALRNGPEATLFGSGDFAGKTLKELETEFEKPYAEILMGIGPKGGSAAYFVMDEELQGNLLIAEGVNICSDGSPTMRHPRGHGSFPRIIRKYVYEDELLTLEQAIHKMSGLAAKTIGLDAESRGTIAVGSYADLLIFDPKQVVDTATFSDPYQLAKGFDTIFVNGEMIRKNGEFLSERNGRILRKVEE